VERELALYGAWYEFFPRSEGDRTTRRPHRWTTGTLRTAAERLPPSPRWASTSSTCRRSTRSASGEARARTTPSTPGTGRPGSPWAIGSPTAATTRSTPTSAPSRTSTPSSPRPALGIEVALDLALQASPDHPWVTEHPEWFTTRADGTIAYAENPPKKYQDIYPLNFDNDPAGIYAEVRRIVQVWIDHGVKIFRVDNPHTKPVEFWEWIIADVAKDHPEVLWLAEAFTKPPMMHTLARSASSRATPTSRVAQHPVGARGVRHRARR
jgi:starch synthase (maltosyl-transferring)